MVFVKRLVVGPLQSNCYIVYNENNNAFIVDPGADSQKIIAVVKSLNLTVDRVFLTHAHFDHISAADDIAAEFNCVAYLNFRDVDLLTDPYLNHSKSFYNSDITYNHSYKAVEDDYTCEVLDEKVKMLSTPGHTPGSCCIVVSNMIFTGDTLFRLSVGNDLPPYGNLELEIKSIKEKLMIIENDLICYPGHGDSTTLFYERSFNPYLN